MLGARVTDIIPQYLTLVPNSIKVKQLKVSENGTMATGAEVNVSNTGGNNLDLSLGDITGAYRIVFETTVNGDAPSGKFNNTAYFGTKSIPADPIEYVNEIKIEKSTPTESRFGQNKSGDALMVNPANEVEWVVTINDETPRKSITQEWSYVIL